MCNIKAGVLESYSLTDPKIVQYVFVEWQFKELEQWMLEKIIIGADIGNICSNLGKREI